ncbi:MAG: hypothetical protein ACI4SO_02570 [Muribaculaceae bacterium]
MKYNIFKNLLLGATVVTAMTACDENSWNKDHLDGFEENEITDVRTVEIELQAADYKKIATLDDNILIAKKLDAQAGGGEDYYNALQAVANGYFTELAPASLYVPAYLNNLHTTSSGSLIGLSNGSYVKVTYETSENAPAVVAGVCASQSYAVSEADYQTVWESETDYVAAFSPSKKASSYLPKILKSQFPDAQSGDYVVVSYNEAGQDPIFNAGGSDEPGGGDEPEPTPSFEMSSVLGSAAAGDAVDVAGVVMAKCSRGFVVSDKTGSMLYYAGSSFDDTAYSVGDQVKFSATVSVYSTGKQLTATTEIEKVGTQSVSYPSPKVYTTSELEALMAELLGEGYVMPDAIYATISGTLSVSGNYFNIIIDGTEAVQGSLYWPSSDMKEQLTAMNGTVGSFTGYITSKSSTKYVNMIVAGYSAASRSSRAVEIASDAHEVIYTYNGSAWSAADVTLLSSEDYASMGIKDFNSTTLYTYLPIYLKNKFPYAQADDVEYVAYKLYDSASKTTILNCSECTFDGAEWKFAIRNTAKAQFALVKNEFIFDPSVVINLPAGKNLEPSKTFFQACTDWVYENVDVPQFGSSSITSGVGYVTSYGNNEYYSGCSAYQGNVDLRAASARKQCASGYEGMEDDEVVALMKKRFESEVCPGALSMLYPDAAPMDGIDLLYTINFVVYNGSSTSYSIVYKVVGKGQFEFVSCTWND